MRKSFCLTAIIPLVLIAGYGCQRSSSSNLPKPKAISQISGNIYGLAYGPFGGMMNPACGPFPTKESIEADLVQVATRTKRIRIYSCVDPNLIEIANKLHLKVLAGCFLSKDEAVNRREINALVRSARQPGVEPKLVVGNETQTAKSLSQDRLLAYLKEVRGRTKARVGTAEVWAVWLDQPELAEACDYLVVHVYGYWDKQPIGESVSYALNRFNQVRAAYPDKEVVLGETGWPSAGETNGQAVPSPENQHDYAQRFINRAETDNIPYYLFEAFSEPWKATCEGGVGPNWGLPLFERDNRLVQTVIDRFPFSVYDEYTFASHFLPSGWMGDYGAIRFYPACTNYPHSGKTCVQIELKPNGQCNWSGIYWQYPENNWGQLPGYRFQGVNRLSFWARGQKGGEQSLFKVGGINGKTYEDSWRLVTLPVTLTKEWGRYTIELPSPSPECVISGFCWVTAPFESKPMTIYLDDINFE